jgi:hypothetical protein
VAPLGPAGSVVATAALLAPLWWFATTDTIGVVGLPLWVFFVLPKALRDVWTGGRRVGTGSARAYRMGRRRSSVHGDGGDSDAIGSRAGPTRW